MAQQRPRSVLGTRALRGIEWALPPAATRAPRECDRRGRELAGSAARPRLVLSPWRDITAERREKRIWSLRPNGTSAKNWSHEPGRATGDRAAVGNLNG